MRNPLRSEAEAFRFLIVVIAGAVIIVAAAYVDMWVGVAAALLVVAGGAVWVLGGPKPAPRVLVSGTPGMGHRVLLLANPGSSGVRGRLGDGVTEVVVVVPALASTLEALTGAVDDRRADAQATAHALAEELRGAGVQARGEVGADDRLLALEDALGTFGADEIVLVDADEKLLAEVRGRFALPVSRV